MTDPIDGDVRAAGGGPADDTGAHPLAPAAPRQLGPVVRLVLAAYALSLVVVGGWAAAFPRSFYDDFPGLGRVWVAVDGPFNEHLVRDVGTLNLALATLLVVAAVRATPTLVAVAAGASLVNAVPHLTYHALHLDLFDTTDQVANVLVLGASVLVPVALLLYLTRRPEA